MQSERRKKVRTSDLLEQQRRGCLEVRGRKLDVYVVDLSPGGFSIRLDRDPEAAEGEVLRLRTLDGLKTVRCVGGCRDDGEGFRLSLELLTEPNRPAGDGDHEEREQEDRRELPAIQFIAVALVVAVAPLLWHQAVPHERQAQGPPADRQVANGNTVARGETRIHPRREGGEDRANPVVAREESRADRQIADRDVRHDAPSATGVDRLADRFDEDFEVEVAAAQARSLIMDCFRYWSFAESLFETSIPEAATEGSPSARSVETSEALPGDPSSPTTEDFGAGALLSATNRDAERAKGQVWFGTGLQFLWGGAYAEAARAFEAASGCAPDDPTYYYFRAISQYAEGRRAVAEQTLASAVQLEADHPVPNLGRMMQRVQGPERRWMEIARRRAKVGPYRPREAHDQPARVQSRP